MNKKKLVSRALHPQDLPKNFHLLSLKLSQSPKKIFSLNAGDDNSKINEMLTTYQRKQLLNLALQRKKRRKKDNLP